MPLSIQMLHVHYHGTTLSILDSDDTTPLYIVETTTKAPQMTMNVAEPPSYLGEPTKSTSPIATASFSALSTEVMLNIHGRIIPLTRAQLLTRTYTFTTPKGDAMFWTADGALTGDFKLIDKSEMVVARFRNKVFCTDELGSFEIVGDVDSDERDVAVISGLAMLTMVQSGTLALLVLVGGK